MFTNLYFPSLHCITEVFNALLCHSLAISLRLWTAKTMPDTISDKCLCMYIYLEGVVSSGDLVVYEETRHLRNPSVGEVVPWWEGLRENGGLRTLTGAFSLPVVGWLAGQTGSDWRGRNKLQIYDSEGIVGLREHLSALGHLSDGVNQSASPGEGGRKGGREGGAKNLRCLRGCAPLLRDPLLTGVIVDEKNCQLPTCTDTPTTDISVMTTSDLHSHPAPS